MCSLMIYCNTTEDSSLLRCLTPSITCALSCSPPVSRVHFSVPSQQNLPFFFWGGWHFCSTPPFEVCAIMEHGVKPSNLICWWSWNRETIELQLCYEISYLWVSNRIVGILASVIWLRRVVIRKVECWTLGWKPNSPKIQRGVEQYSLFYHVQGRFICM
jgi:hypothetical protein